MQQRDHRRQERPIRQRRPRAFLFPELVPAIIAGMLCTMVLADAANAEGVGSSVGSILAAQARDTIRGKVTEQGTGQPVADVVVLVPGTDVQTVTNADGDYRLEVPATGRLVFARLGYRSAEVELAGQERIDIAMEVSAAELAEIVVTGYSAQRRADITGAIASVDMESVTRETSSSVLHRLAGNVAGVTVDASGSPGARSTVRIRGVGSFQNNDPLFIIDGTPVSQGSSNSGMGGAMGVPSGFANALNPNDIESIQVLKDASAASIYGARASNGVVIIETKKGSEGPTRYRIDARFGVATPYRGYDDFVMLDALEYYEVVKRSHINAGLDVPTNYFGDPDNPAIPRYTSCGGPPHVPPVNGTCPGLDESAYAWPDNLIMPGSAGTNWWDAVFGSAPVMDVNLRVAGGSEASRYNVSFNYYDQKGTAAHNRFQRGTIRVNTDFGLGRLTVGENVNLSLEEGYGGMANDPGGFAENSIVGKNVLMQPVVPVYDIAGNFASAGATGLGNHTNPLKLAWANKDNVASNFRMFGNAFARLDVTDGITANTSFSFDLGNASLTTFNEITPENSEPNLTNNLQEQTRESRDWTWTNTLTWNIGSGGPTLPGGAGAAGSGRADHNVAILLGQATTKESNRFIGASIAGLISTDINGRYIQDALGDASTKDVNSAGGVGTILSYFGKIDYSYADRYYLSFTMRRDGSSRLGEANRWGTFPAFNVGWRLSAEPLLGLPQSSFLTNLMLRFGWGITGNQNIAAGRTVDQFGGSTGDTFYDTGGSGGPINTGFRQTALGNPDLKWEENRSVNVGFDAEFFGGSASLNLDVYRRDSDNLLFNPPLPATAGFAAAPIVNIGQVRNTGFDLGIGFRGTFGDEADWDVSINGAHYKNEVVRIDGVQDFFFGPITTRFATQTITINRLGSPIGAFYGWIHDGIFQNQAEIDQLNELARQQNPDDPEAVYQDGAAPGRFRFRDVDGDGRVSAEDRTIIGDPHPDFTAGLNLGLRWKRWDVNASVFGTFGNDIFDVQKEFYVFRLFNSNVRRDLLTDAAVVEDGEVVDPDAKYPRLDVNDEFSSEPSSFYVEDGSYVRLRSLQLGYTVPESWTRGLGNARIWLQGENLLTLTGYSGLDPSLPAANVFNAGMDVRDQARGIDRGVYPTSRIITLGFSVEF